MVDDLFCASIRLSTLYFVIELTYSLTVTHYAEGSLMPLLVNKLIFGLVPTKAPFILRPILRAVFSQIDRAFLAPRLKIHAKLVCTGLQISF